MGVVEGRKEPGGREGDPSADGEHGRLETVATKGGPGRLAPRLARWVAALCGLLAAIVFSALAGLNLDAQGPQYDELHQAVGAFTWIGAPAPSVFCLDAGGTCVLTTTYSAALKTAIYGLWLRVAGHSFDLVEWRRLGIGLAALGVLLLIATLVRFVGLRAGLIAAGLMLSDATLLLYVRFDFGPVALGFLLRAAMIALWLAEDCGRAGAAPRPRWTAAIAFLAGLATFEKLSSVVLLAALGPLLFARPERRTRRHVGSALVGLGCGALPLVAVNLAWWWRAGEWISLRGASAPGAAPVLEYLREFLALGAGRRAQSFTLGLTALPLFEVAEAVAIGAVVLVVLLTLLASSSLAGHRWSGESAAPRGAAALGWAYLATALGLALLPRPTAAHHWILGTPFQYLAAAMVVDGWLRPNPRRWARAVALAVLLVPWGIGRGVQLVSIERALLDGRAGRAFHPDLSELMRFVAERSAGAIFVASDWGIGTQMASATSGRGIVLEPFWSYAGVGAVEAAQRQSGRAEMYLVRLRDERPAFAVRQRIEGDIAGSRSWFELPLDDRRLADSAVVTVRCFRWSAGAG